MDSKARSTPLPLVAHPERLLADYAVVRSDSIQPFSDYIAGMEGRVERKWVAAEPVNVELRHARLAWIDIAISYWNVTMTTARKRDAASEFLVQFPLTGGFELRVDGREFAVTPGKGAVISSPQDVQRMAQPGWTLVFSIPYFEIASRLEARLGYGLAETLEFHPLIQANAKEILDYGLLVVDAIDRGAAPSEGSVASVLAEGFIQLLLELQPHSHGRPLAQSEVGRRAERVQAVADYLQNHAGEAVTVEQLARVAGCGIRALQTTFVELCGMTPHEYVQRHRLSEARRQLETAVPGTTVSTIASSVGFSHLGRFSAQYKRRYGESPSQTLQRAVATADHDQGAVTVPRKPR